MDAWNPYYAFFARSQGRSPEAQQAEDRRDQPEGNALPFILWISQERRRFQRAHPEAWDKSGDRIADHDAWARWLEDASTSHEAQLLASPAPQQTLFGVQP